MSRDSRKPAAPVRSAVLLAFLNTGNKLLNCLKRLGLGLLICMIFLQPGNSRAQHFKLLGISASTLDQLRSRKEVCPSLLIYPVIIRPAVIQRGCHEIPIRVINGASPRNEEGQEFPAATLSIAGLGESVGSIMSGDSSGRGGHGHANKFNVWVHRIWYCILEPAIVGALGGYAGGWFGAWLTFRANK